MAKIKTTRWDLAEELKTPEDRALFLEAVFEDTASGDLDAGLIAAALGEVARSMGMAEVAKKAGLGRESLYKALAPGHNPELATVLKVMKALGLRLQVVPMDDEGVVGVVPRDVTEGRAT